MKATAIVDHVVTGSMESEIGQAYRPLLRDVVVTKGSSTAAVREQCAAALDVPLESVSLWVLNNARLGSAVGEYWDDSVFKETMALAVHSSSENTVAAPGSLSIFVREWDCVKQCVGPRNLLTVSSKSQLDEFKLRLTATSSIELSSLWVLRALPYQIRNPPKLPYMNWQNLNDLLSGGTKAHNLELPFATGDTLLYCDFTHASSILEAAAQTNATTADVTSTTNSDMPRRSRPEQGVKINY